MPRLSTQILGQFRTGMDRSSRRGGKDGAQRLWLLQNGYINERGEAVPRPGLQHVASVLNSVGLYGWQGQLHVFHGEDDYVDPGNPLVQGHVLRYPFVEQPLAIAGALPDAFVGVAITPYAYAISGGAAPYASVTISTGALPNGLVLSNSGVVSGTPTTTGAFSWTVKVIDADGKSATISDGASVSDHLWLIAYNGVSVNGSAAAGTYTETWKPSVVSNQLGYVYKDGTNLYISTGSTFSSVSESTDGGATWGGIGSGIASASGGRMAFTSGYQFLCSGSGNSMYRRAGGAWSQPFNTGRAAFATAIVNVNGTLLICGGLPSGSQSQASISTDNGTTWTFQPGYYANLINACALATNGTRVVIAVDEQATNQISIKYSDNLGVSWTLAYTFPSPASGVVPTDAVYTGSGWIVTTSSGAVAHSVDGITWALSASTIGMCNQMAAGAGKVVAACNGALIYESTDNGATWSVVAPPSDAAGTAINGVAWLG